jgi:hypothetical protein
VSRRPPRYTIPIREDRPFVLDFRGKPEVLFASPARRTRVRPGGKIDVAAVLVDPGLDIMIRRLDDSRDTVEQEFTTPDGKKRTWKRPRSLDPKVTITRSDGTPVAEGVMPFG